ncbi:uncharacterized protein BDW70DRAFT_67950 [Aspergillus foveolatus]|uniref:uncharacterized protein n=1 Tax=Aspergillus foveolatus TaxID=210207 RepID=UPI003CCD10F2
MFNGDPGPNFDGSCRFTVPGRFLQPGMFCSESSQWRGTCHRTSYIVHRDIVIWSSTEKRGKTNTKTLHTCSVIPHPIMLEVQTKTPSTDTSKEQYSTINVMALRNSVSLGPRCSSAETRLTYQPWIIKNRLCFAGRHVPAHYHRGEKYLEKYRLGLRCKGEDAG